VKNIEHAVRIYTVDDLELSHLPTASLTLKSEDCVENSFEVSCTNGCDLTRFDLFVYDWELWRNVEAENG
jgi:hypothetical protein